MGLFNTRSLKSHQNAYFWAWAARASYQRSIVISIEMNSSFSFISRSKIRQFAFDLFKPRFSNQDLYWIMHGLKIPPKAPFTIYNMNNKNEITYCSSCKHESIEASTGSHSSDNVRIPAGKSR